MTATSTSEPDWGAPGDPQPQTGGPPPEADDPQAEPSAYFPDFQTWMVEWLAPTVRRPLRSGVMWCSEWWRHPEVVTRLDALWRAWEAARVEGGAGMSYWWTTHFDAHWSVLTSDRGPFVACKDKTHDGRLDMLPCDPPPENWAWPSDKEQQ